MNNERKVLLKVENLEQSFKIGKKTLKAINDISFEVYKGEVFGLVGESGCGKTTTGRSIIRLYDITGGSVYFDGTRICAGTQAYVDNINRELENKNLIVKKYKKKIAKIKAKYKVLLKEVKGDESKTAKLIEDRTQEISKISEIYDAELAVANEMILKVREENLPKIDSAQFDHKNCNKQFAKHEVQKVVDKYESLLEKETDATKLEQLEKEFKMKKKLASKDRIMNKIQMIFQDPIASLNPRMTVSEIIAEGLIIRGIKDKKFINKEVHRVLELVGLVPEHASRYPHEFSGGQRQRIGIARAIVLNPELIIADEPISALDVSIQAQVINLLNELRDKMGLTTLFIAHDLSVVKYFSDRIAVMYFGKIVELATSEELFKNPLHPYTRSLFSAIPLPDPYFEKKRKRITYNPLNDHDYTKEKPKMHEIKPGHFIYCNSIEFEKYKKEIKE